MGGKRQVSKKKSGATVRQPLVQVHQVQ